MSGTDEMFPETGEATAFEVESSPRGNEPREVSLSRLIVELKRKFNEVGLIAVDGEISNPKSYRTMVYFVLRDRNSQLSVRVKMGLAKQCRIVDGERVRVVGRLDVNGDRGSFQLDALDIQPVGEGAIAAAIAQVRERLNAEGILSRPRKPLPLLPRAIAVVCGTEAAVRHDIESVIADRFPGFPVVWFETTVQGPSAVGGICAALDRVDANDGVDVVILARGGGDATALLPFSDDKVCRRVASMRVPAVSAIGHDADRPLLDEVADVRCGTPSIAAALVVPRESELRARASARLEAFERALFDRIEAAESELRRRQPTTAVHSVLSRARGRLAQAEAVRRSRHPRIVAERARSRLQGLSLHAHHPVRIAQARTRLSIVNASLEALDPMRVLERGFALVRDAEGRVVRSIQDVSPDQALAIHVADGSIHAAVTTTTKEHQ